jgi:hypothetical protein
MAQAQDPVSWLEWDPDAGLNLLAGFKNARWQSPTAAPGAPSRLGVLYVCFPLLVCHLQTLVERDPGAGWPHRRYSAEGPGRTNLTVARPVLRGRGIHTGSTTPCDSACRGSCPLSEGFESLHDAACASSFLPLVESVRVWRHMDVPPSRPRGANPACSRASVTCLGVILVCFLPLPGR